MSTTATDPAATARSRQKPVTAQGDPGHGQATPAGTARHRAIRLAALHWTLSALLLAVGIAAGVIWSHASRWPEESYLSLKAALREASGLPKRWQALPVMVGKHIAVPCPDPGRALVIVTGGQSNSANANSSLSRPAPAGTAVDWYDGTCYVSADPVPGASGKQGSLWPEIGAGLAEKLGRPVVMIHGGIGGSQIGDWLDERSGYYNALSARVAAAQRAGYQPDLILWHQGETDAARHPAAVDVYGRLGQLMDRLLQDMPEASVYLFQASKCTGRNRETGVSAIRKAQVAVALARDRVIEGFNTDSLGNDFRWDTCHFNSQGRDAIRATVVPDILALAGGMSSAVP